MARIETWFNQDLQEPVRLRYLDGSMFSADNKGNLIGVIVTDGGNAATLTGSVTGYCILASGLSIPVAGTLTNNKASIVLPDTAYAGPGLINIIIKLVGSGFTTTLAAVVSNVIGLGEVVESPSQATIDQWEAQINATISALQTGAVRYDTTQSLTAAQKARAQSNIGANTVATLISGEDYKIAIP